MDNILQWLYLFYILHFNLAPFLEDKVLYSFTHTHLYTNGAAMQSTAYPSGATQCLQKHLDMRTVATVATIEKVAAELKLYKLNVLV